MATPTLNGPKANAGEIKQVLVFLKDLVTNQVLNAIRLLLKPCCKVTPEISAHCTSPSEVTVTGKANVGAPITGAQAYLLDVFNSVISGPVGFDGTAVFPGINGFAPGTVDLKLLIFIPTATDGSVGVSVITDYQVVTIDYLPCSISDIRLKEDITFLGKSPKGINIYSFKYIGKEGKYQGAMAQELLGTPFADAVVPGDTYAVDYSKIDVEFKKLD